MSKKRIIALFVMMVFLFQLIMPTLYECYAVSENVTDIESNTIEAAEEKLLENEPVIQNEEKEDDLQIEMNEDSGISVASASGFGVGAGNEDEFRNAFYNTSVSELTTSQIIRLTSTYTVNHNIRIDSSSTSGGNSLHLASGCSIVVQSGCVLTLDGIVVDGRTWGNNDSKVCITVKSGGVLMLTDHAIIDGGTKNWGINVESGGQLLIESAQICYCDRGIVVQGNSYCDLASSTVVSWWGNTGKNVDIIHNDTGIYVGGEFCGSLVINHTSQENDKINFEYNSWGIFSEGHFGSINIIRARMVNNGWAIYSFGNMSINNLNGAYNTRGIVNCRRNN